MYQAVIHGEAVKLLLAQRMSDRETLLDFFQQLAKDPFRNGDFSIKDTAGRIQQIKLINGFLITYYADHAVKEMRVTDIERI